MDMSKPTSYTMAMMDFFGKKPNQTTAELAQEFKALTEADKAEFKDALVERGYNIV